MKKKRFVCLGGGNAMPKAVLLELKKKPVFISAICAMLDSGGSAGRLRKDYDISSPGDIRRAFLALANTSPVIESLFNFRFETGELKGHNFANLFITALELSVNDYKKSVKEIRKTLNIKESHEVLPSTLDKAHLYAKLENGKIIKGETNIDIPKHDGNLRIKKVFLKPKAKAYPRSLEAVKKADYIIIGPGDLYSSLAQIILTDKMAETILKSKAKKIYICNLINKFGETNNYSVMDFSLEIENLLKGELDFVIYNNKKIDSKRTKEYRNKNKELMEQVHFDKNLSKNKFIGRDVITSSGDVVHDSKKVIKTIFEIIKK
jgi:uncharacterized cofD-like protein